MSVGRECEMIISDEESLMYFQEPGSSRLLWRTRGSRRRLHSYQQTTQVAYVEFHTVNQYLFQHYF